jgi:hypothetical protein
MPELLIAEPTGSPAALMTDDGEFELIQWQNAQMSSAASGRFNFETLRRIVCFFTCLLCGFPKTLDAWHQFRKK